ncbi:hypothetical protein GIB67_005060, partial [Kingdonia uniflora]
VPNNWGQPSQFVIPTQFQHPSSFANLSQSQLSQSHDTQSVNLSQFEDAGVVNRQKRKNRRRSTKTTTNAGGSQLLKWTGIQNKILQKLGFMSRWIESKATTNNLMFFGSQFWMHFMNFVKRMVNGLNVQFHL